MRSLTAVCVLQATALGQTAAEYYQSLNLEKPEAENAAIRFSRQRTHSLARDDTIRPFSKIEVDSHQNFYDFLDNVDIAAITPIKQEWIINVCGMSRMDSFTAIPKVGVGCCLPAEAAVRNAVHVLGLTCFFVSVQYFADEMVNEMLSEVNGLYYESVKRSIADYVLLNEDERRRLQVTATPRESAFQRRLEFDFGDT